VDENFLKPYQMTLKTISPVHIGSGAKLYRSDFITQNGQCIVIDENRLLNWIAGRPDAERLAITLADSLRDPKRGIQDFLSREPLKSQLLLSSVQAYSLKFSGRPRDVLVFIKDDGQQPYIPGSSLKGALRSALLRGKMLGDTALQKHACLQIQQGVPRKKTNSEQIEAKLFVPSAQSGGKAPNFDINRMLVIRDSEAIPSGKLQVAPIKVLSVDLRDGLSLKKVVSRGSEFPMEIYAEVLQNGISVHMELVWQTHFLSKQARKLGFQTVEYLFAFLPEYCRRASQNLLEQERDFYKRHGQAELQEWFEKRLSELNALPENAFYLPLGWGSGYDAKTITDLLGEKTFETVVKSFKNTEGLGKPGRRRDANWLGPADSPKSRKVVVHADGRLEPLGWVEVRLIPSEQSDWLAAEREALKSKKPASVVLQPSASAGTVGKSPAPVTTKAPISPAYKPQPQPIIERFDDVPKIGNRFYGTVLQTGNQVMLEIPGREDTEDYAVIDLSNRPIKRPREGEKVLCEVIAVKKEKNYWRVECILG